MIRVEKKQELRLSHKKKSNLSADHIGAMITNLGNNQVSVQSEQMHGSAGKIAASVCVAGAFDDNRSG